MKIEEFERQMLSHLNGLGFTLAIINYKIIQAPPGGIKQVSFKIDLECFYGSGGHLRDSNLNRIDFSATRDLEIEADHEKTKLELDEARLEIARLCEENAALRDMAQPDRKGETTSAPDKSLMLLRLLSESLSGLGRIEEHRHDIRSIQDRLQSQLWEADQDKTLHD